MEENDFSEGGNLETLRYLSENLEKYPSLVSTLIGVNGQREIRTEETLSKINVLAHIRSEHPTQTIDYLFSQNPSDITLLLSLVPKPKDYVSKTSQEIHIFDRNSSRYVIHS